ncbi:deoxyribonuclease IV [Fundidesulfovibrio soli]|uniref:deoxyribonuclease IV n=1 Tax=Fundidesulfovibrio soli TaxID=2922716 RepID=UPI001FAFA075|nr:deoxyribonuclease IV [Fundidesulfovibrio soli]
MSAKGLVRRIGAHESVAGGLHTAFERIASVGGTALQIFTRNQRQWDAAPVTDEEAALFVAAWERWGSYPVASHASYLINVASADDALRGRSVAALAAELERCRRLGVPWVVLHPGARGSAGLEEALARAAASLDQAFESGAEGGPLILLENTAGQGSALGGDLAELAAIAGLTRHQGRIGFCFDTCHGFAAGYDVRTSKGLDAALSHLDPSRLLLLHANDSKGGLGSHLDRHEHIGQGAIGLEGFSSIVNHPQLAWLPMILETHKEKDLAEDVRNLAALRGLMSENRSSG